MDFDKDALDISMELIDWALVKTNKTKARKLNRLARKYKNIWDER